MLVKDIHHLENHGGVIVQKMVKTSLGTKVKEKQDLDFILMQITNDMGHQKVMDFGICGDGVLRYQRRLCVPGVDRLQKRILSKAYESRGLVAKVSLRTGFLPQVDGQAKRTIQTLDDMLQPSVIDFGGSWVDHLPLIELAYNNIYHSSIGMALFEVLYGRRYHSLIGLFEVDGVVLFYPDLVHRAMKKVCHKHGVIHRDLKPENFLYANATENTQLKAIGFGLSIFFEPETEEGIAHAIVKGTIDFNRYPWPRVSDEAKDLLKGMLDANPYNRFTVEEVLASMTEIKLIVFMFWYQA
ncbi:hypothetical protein FXO37_30417 [Capsicum annuum]|nr:hypothetical protein FXO37_30417 [Capsicum annuum]